MVADVVPERLLVVWLKATVAPAPIWLMPEVTVAVSVTAPAAGRPGWR